jgi:alpha-tubulin suppressor-like RCC1 family protein
MAICTDGGLYSWGCGYAGRLGHGGEEFTGAPIRVPALSSEPMRAVSHSRHSLAIACSGTVYTWGGIDDDSDHFVPVLLKLPSDFGDVVGVSAHSDISVVVTADGKVCTWRGEFSAENMKLQSTEQAFPTLLSALQGKSVASVAPSLVTQQHGSDAKPVVLMTDREEVICVGFRFCSTEPRVYSL